MPVFRPFDERLLHDELLKAIRCRAPGSDISPPACRRAGRADPAADLSARSQVLQLIVRGLAKQIAYALVSPSIP
jgi:hypothetical protein